jgi:hypothetical protein
MDVNTLISQNRMPIIIVVGIILLYIIYLLAKKYILVRGPSSTVASVLVPAGMDVNKDNTDDIIKNNTIPALEEKDTKDFIKSFQLTTFVYVYLSDFDKNLGMKRNIVYKPHTDGSVNFQWSINPQKNDVVFEIKLSNGLNGTVTIPNIQLRTWTSVACIIDGNQGNFYKDGKYYRSVIFNGIPIFTNTPIVLGKGFNQFSPIQTYSGFLATFYYSYRAEDESLITNLHKSRPNEPLVKPEDDKCPTLETQLTGSLTNLGSSLFGTEQTGQTQTTTTSTTSTTSTTAK